MSKKESSASFISFVLWVLALLALIAMVLSALSIPGFAATAFDAIQDAQDAQAVKAANCNISKESRVVVPGEAFAGEGVLANEEALTAYESVLNAQKNKAKTEYEQVAIVSPDLIQAVQEQADDSMRQAWQEGSENHTQPVNKIVGSDGSVVLAQNAPRRIVSKSAWPQPVKPGLSDRHTTITVIQAVPTPIPTPLPRPTPLPTPVPKQETRINTVINGVDNIETKAVLPELLSVDQLDAVKKIADNGTLIAQQRFGLEQYGIQQETQLEYLRIVKSFTLWGFLASIPFILTLFHIGKGVIKGIVESKKSHYEFKLEELKASERVIYDRVPEGEKS